MKLLFTFLILFLISVLGFSQGWKTDTALSAKVPQKTIMDSSVFQNLPKSVDLSKFVPSVIDQENYDTCIPVASTYYLRTMLEAIKLGITNEKGYTKIDALRYSPSYIYALIRRDTLNDCKTYTYIEDAMEALKTKGAVKYNVLDYPNCNPDLSKLSPERESQILDYVRLFSLIDDGNKVNATRLSLADNLPLVVGLQVNVTLKKLGRLGWIWHKIKEFFGFEDEEFALWKPDDANLIDGHGVCVVGYDDTKFGNKGAFKIVNSRGEYWGEDGYFWILYTDYERLAKQAYQAIMPKIPKEDIKYAGEVSYLTDNYGNSQDSFSAENEALVLKNYKADSMNFLTAYTFKEPIRHNSHFRFFVKTEQDFYIYILDENLENNEINIVFPQEFDEIQDYEVKKQKNNYFPLENNWSLQGPFGKEKVLFLFSKNILDIYDYLDKFNTLTGMSFDQKVKAVFGKELIPEEYIDYEARDPKKMKFYVTKKAKTGSIVPLIFSYEHI
ncbi:DUF4384 domain-containing protein [Lacihabitans sp. LS3-19]|uniref:DUF4384 domain-containing protein n=1 Tax=Lacihabitans sp. LS3-19 TaxID=2487335 RepID=UPI0020CBD078|nr:DUF4384 domain-containing protein [Lacihabitans sp. LS3-19]MCP9768493.1 DUF4384 domain-containing protein [Lacihabitans sp. LS3-19]